MQPPISLRTQWADTMHPCLVLTANFEIPYRKIEDTVESILKVQKSCSFALSVVNHGSHLVNNGFESTPDFFAQEGPRTNFKRDQHAPDAETSQDYCVSQRLDQQGEGAGMVDLDGNNATADCREKTLCHASLINCGELQSGLLHH